ncbi:class I SAM-dependent methyltransferase [Pseudonocardia endophytica]|uniref:Methyltransferase family protein n=1 Tax=Pseudonocardia endophytica TaxID=401976 RepID=A0A4R1HNR3_PSEEN|nr:class I SAM-dependent methyltransferase [Pseudonocardia endophytica]TCK22841.1 methyltransferase family protein [Pseudonocardia endophytica]
MATSYDFDAAEWLRRWDVQQEGYVPDREAMFDLMFDVVDGLGAAPGRLLDLACGPGSLARRALARFPGAQVTGVDFDPVMLELARRTTGDAASWVDADLSGPEWTDVVGDRYDAAVSATALHWLAADDLPGFAEALASVLRPGGVFVDFDTLKADPEPARLAAMTAELRIARTEARTGSSDFEDFQAWWAAVVREPALADVVADRERRFAGRERSGGSTIGQWEAALRGAGFAEVGTVTQLLDRRMLAAIR